MEDGDVGNLFLKYEFALKELKCKFNNIYTELSKKMGENNPIEHIKYRIKKYDSIKAKLLKNNLEFSAKAIEENLNDVVGVRIVCSFLNDMDTIINIIRNNPQMEVLKEKDYIKDPKESGYSSYHMIIRIPVLMARETVYVKAEIQIRTIAIDMWASLEHKISYKKNIVLPNEMVEEIEKTRIMCNIIDNYANELIKKSPALVTNNPLTTSNTISDADFNTLMFKYKIALKRIESIIDTIYYEFELESSINPIEHVKSRLKSKERIYEKLESKHEKITLKNIEEKIGDVAGIRVVCSFRSDLDNLISIIKEVINESKELIMLTEKDYVNFPKESGYMGYHLLIAVPINLLGSTSYAKVEIQIRTIAMDMWASLEQKICYKKIVNASIKEELANFASSIDTSDIYMDSIIKKSLEEQDVLVKKKAYQAKNY